MTVSLYRCLAPLFFFDCAYAVIYRAGIVSLSVGDNDPIDSLMADTKRSRGQMGKVRTAYKTNHTQSLIYFFGGVTSPTALLLVSYREQSFKATYA